MNVFKIIISSNLFVLVCVFILHLLAFIFYYNFVNFLFFILLLIGAGLVLNWEQHTCQLLASGDVRHIRIWDAEREAKIQVYI